jgi:hypothetical protein
MLLQLAIATGRSPESSPERAPGVAPRAPRCPGRPTAPSRRPGRPGRCRSGRRQGQGLDLASLAAQHPVAAVDAQVLDGRRLSPPFTGHFLGPFI